MSDSDIDRDVQDVHGVMVGRGVVLAPLARGMIRPFYDGFVRSPFVTSVFTDWLADVLAAGTRHCPTPQGEEEATYDEIGRQFLTTEARRLYTEDEIEFHGTVLGKLRLLGDAVVDVARDVPGSHIELQDQMLGTPHEVFSAAHEVIVAHTENNTE